jgi:hypothetical protein
MLRSIAAAGLFAIATAGTAHAACPAPFAADRTFYKGISPSDGPLEVWCRIQSTPGEYLIDAFFADTNVHRARKFTFHGQGRELGPEVFQEFIQSMIPYRDGPAVDPDGMAFSRVLQRVVQGSASATPSKPSYQLSAPPQTPGGKAAMLWETFAIRMKPVNVGGTDFALTIKFQPSPGRLLYETQDGLPGLIVGGWKERLDLGDYFNKSCSPMIPACKDLPEIVPIHFAMAVEKVILQADGPDLSNVADMVLKKIDADTPGTKVGTDPNTFDPVKGIAKREISDLPFVVTVEAKAENGKPRTSQLGVVWEQRQGQGMSYAERLSTQFSERVINMIRGMSAQNAQTR